MIEVTPDTFETVARTVKAITSMALTQFLTDLLLSPILIFFVLALIFLVISYWSLGMLREYAGYVLGCLVGVFVVIVVSALGVQPDTAAQNVELEATTLTLFQALCPAIGGLVIGIVFLVIPRLADVAMPTNSQAVLPRGIKVAAITSLWVTLLFLFFLVGIQTQRMIGIFALAFMIARLFAVVMSGGQNPREMMVSQAGMMNAQMVDPNLPYDPLTGDPMMPPTSAPPPAGGSAFTRLDAIRARMSQRNPPR